MPADRAHAWTALWRWLLGCALVGCLVGVAQAQERVLLQAPETPDPLLLELYHRLEAELRIHGFETVTLVATPDESARKDLGAQASARRALAAIAVVMRNRSAALDVWLVAADGGGASLRSLTASAGDETANLVAVRAVDLLRASLTARGGRAPRAETAASEPARTTRVTPAGSNEEPASTSTSAPSAAAARTPVEPEHEDSSDEEPQQPAAPRPARPQPVLSFRAEAFGLWQGPRFGPALGPALGARFCPLSHLCLSASAAGAFGLERLETALGSAAVRQELFFAELEIPLVWLGDLQLAAAAGGGVMLLQAKGHPDPPRSSLNAAQWGWTVGAGPRLTLELNAHWSLTAALHVRVYLPDVGVAVASEVALLARPTLDAALGVAYSP